MVRASARLFVLAAFFLPAHLAETDAEAPNNAVLGVRPEDQAKYAAAASRGMFECPGMPKGSPQITVPFASVNDDFCVCADGSDEPGTGACAGQKETLFYCANEKSIASYLYASRVNDGICDCCDGSDDRISDCPNTCEREGVELRRELERKEAEWRKGVAKRQRLIENAKSERERGQKEILRLRDRLPALEAAKNVSQASLEVARQALEEEQRQTQAEEPTPNASATDAPSTEALAEVTAPVEEDVDTKTVSEGETHANKGEEKAVSEYAKWMDGAEKALDTTAASADRTIRFDAGKLGISCDAESGEIKEIFPGSQGENAHLRIGMRLKAVNGKTFTNELLRDTIDSGEAYEVTFEEASKAEEKKPSDQPQEVKTPEVSEYTKWMDGADKVLGAGTEEAASTPSQNSQQVSATSSPSPEDSHGLWEQFRNWTRRTWVSIFGEAQTPAERVFRKAEKAHEAATKEEADTRKELEDLERKARTNADDDSLAYSAMVGKCVSKKLGEYNYEVCFNDKANQDSTSIGTWQHWETPTVGLFDNGQYCPGGPSRSLRIRLQCGAGEEILEVTEPSRCTYEAKIVHPAACSGPLPMEASKGRVRKPTDEL